MNILPRKSPVDLDKLREDILTTRPEQNTHPSPQQLAYDSYAPRPTGEPQEKTYTPLQVIGHAITRLTYKDAVNMGEAIQALLKEGELTAAIQEWAADWDKFQTNQGDEK